MSWQVCAPQPREHSGPYRACKGLSIGAVKRRVRPRPCTRSQHDAHSAGRKGQRKPNRLTGETAASQATGLQENGSRLPTAAGSTC